MINPWPVAVSSPRPVSRPRALSCREPSPGACHAQPPSPSSTPRVRRHRPARPVAGPAGRRPDLPLRRRLGTPRPVRHHAGRRRRPPHALAHQLAAGHRADRRPQPGHGVDSGRDAAQRGRRAQPARLQPLPGHARRRPRPGRGGRVALRGDRRRGPRARPRDPLRDRGRPPALPAQPGHLHHRRLLPRVARAPGRGHRDPRCRRGDAGRHALPVQPRHPRAGGVPRPRAVRHLRRRHRPGGPGAPAQPLVRPHPARRVRQRRPAAPGPAGACRGPAHP